MKRVKVIQIGFNKTGTSSLGAFFKRNGYRIIGSWKAKHIHDNLNNGKKAFKDLSFDLAQDLEDHSLGIYIWKEYMKIYDQYPDAKYILTTRSCEKWVNSRLNHRNGRYARIDMRQKNIKKVEDLIYSWKKEFYSFHGEVLNFFEKKSNFYINDLDNINSSSLIEYIGEGYTFKKKKFPRVNSAKSNDPPSFDLDSFAEMDKIPFSELNSHKK